MLQFKLSYLDYIQRLDGVPPNVHQKQTIATIRQSDVSLLAPFFMEHHTGLTQMGLPDILAPIFKQNPAPRKKRCAGHRQWSAHGDDEADTDYHGAEIDHSVDAGDAAAGVQPGDAAAGVQFGLGGVNHAYTSRAVDPTAPCHRLHFRYLQQNNATFSSYLDGNLVVFGETIGRQSQFWPVRKIDLVVGSHDDELQQLSIWNCPCPDNCEYFHVVTDLLTASVRGKLTRPEDVREAIASSSQCRHVTASTAWTHSAPTASSDCTHCSEVHDMVGDIPSIPVGEGAELRRDELQTEVLVWDDIGGGDEDVDYLVLSEDGGLAFVNIREGVFRCRTCVRGRRSCPHSEQVRNNFGDVSWKLLSRDPHPDDANLPNNAARRAAAARRAQCSTESPIALPFSLNAVLSTHELHGATIAANAAVQTREDIAPLVLRDSACPKCLNPTENFTGRHSATVLCSSGEYPDGHAFVENTLCDACGEIPYSGGGMCVGIDNNKVLATHEVMLRSEKMVMLGKTSILSAFNTLAASIKAAGGELGRVSYVTFLALLWAFMFCRVLHLKNIRALTVACIKHGLAPCRQIWDGTYLSMLRRRIPAPIPPAAGAFYHPRAVEATHIGANAGYLYSVAERSSMQAFLKGIEARSLVCVLSADVELPVVNDENILHVLSCFQVPLPPRAKREPLKTVLRFIHDISTKMSVLPLLMGSDAARVVIIIDSLLAELTSPAPRQPRFLSHLADFRKEASYLAEIFSDVHRASWLASSVSASISLLHITRRIACLAADQPSCLAPLTSRNVCSSCDESITAYVYGLAVGRVDRQAISSADMVYFLTILGPLVLAARMSPASHRLLPHDATAKDVIADIGSYAGLYGGFSSEAQAVLFARTHVHLLARTDSSGAPMYKVTPIVDDFDLRLANEHRGVLTGMPFVRPQHLLANDPAAPSKCSRTSHVNPRTGLGPGMLFSVCSCLCISLGAILHMGESSRQVALLLYQVCPFMPDIHYDLACKLHADFLQFDPRYLEDARVLLDELHKWNHTACPRVFRPEHHPSMRGENTQAAEQVNSMLAALKRFVQYMTYDHFVLFMQLFIHTHNERMNEQNAADAGARL